MGLGSVKFAELYERRARERVANLCVEKISNIALVTCCNAVVVVVAVAMKLQTRPSMQLV